MASVLSPLRSIKGAPLRTSAGDLLWALVPLPGVVPLPPDPTTGRPPPPKALLTSTGFNLRTSSGALLLPGFAPLPAVVPIPPDPTTGRLPPPSALLTSAGFKLRTASGALVLPGILPLPAVRFIISGVTKDNTGAVLGACAIALYRTATDAFVERVTSDGAGNYSFSVAGPAQNYYLVVYKAGAPDVTGASANTLTGA